ncbi:MAG: HD domain-containing protein [Propionibacteriaceae bacterium]|nr:HD domain-containing protein [Propionibacteriaceae bacterium]
MRTRLTHALEVAQVATSIARGVGANATLADAIALGHDCGHGPGGHASEDAFDEFIPGGFEHGPWGADVVLAGLNLCAETLDGIRNHSWSRPTPASVEGEIVSWADRIGYCAHDLEDAIRAGIISESDVPAEIAAVCGRTRREQLSTFIRAMIAATCRNGFVSMDPERAAALSALREFNYERIYTRPEAIAQSRAVIAVLRALVEHYASHPELLPPLGAAAVGAKDGPRDGTMDGTRDGPRDGTMDETRDGTMDETMDETRTVADGAAKGPAVEGPAVKGPTAERFVGRCEAGEDGGTGGDDRIVDSVLAAVTYVAGMTDRFAFDTAVALLGWDRDSLPKGV